MALADESMPPNILLVTSITPVACASTTPATMIHAGE